MHLFEYIPWDRSGSYVARPIILELDLFLRISKNFHLEEGTAKQLVVIGRGAHQKNARFECSLQGEAILIDASGDQQSQKKHFSEMKIPSQFSNKAKHPKETVKDANLKYIQHF